MVAHTINFREQGLIRPRIDPWLVLLLCLIGTCGGCVSGGKNMTQAESACSVVQETDGKEPPQGVLNNVDDLLTVNCLLPGQSIQIGMFTTWMSPPRPAIITAWECKVQGGQYAIGPNNDARQTALNVWQQCANQGDKVAQNYLGEIYARQWGDIKPDFSDAAEWFRKAAEQGYSRAQKNLAVLYEQGLGVPKDPEKAFKLYRQAIGQIAPINLDQNTKGEILELSQKLDATGQKTKALQQQLSEVKQSLQRKQDELDKLKNQNAPEDNQAQLKVLKQELDEALLGEKKLREQLSDSQQQLEADRNQLTKTETHAAVGVMPNMGQYYALIIGIDDYQPPLAKLKTPVNDAKQVEVMLRQKYGFKTTLLTDDAPIKPTRAGIYKALYDLSLELNDNDNLLIYYAGHGDISDDNRYRWLPEDADSKTKSQWISLDDIKAQIDTPPMKAKHVLIVADSCYPAGLIASAITTTPITTAAMTPPLIATRSTATITGSMSIPYGIPNLADTDPDSQVAYIKFQAQNSSRTALTSGGLEPVLDEDSGNGLSIFANAFLEALNKNDDVISAEQIKLEISPEVFAKAIKRGKGQSPVYGAIPNTVHNFGEFFFVTLAKKSDFQEGKYRIAATATK